MVRFVFSPQWFYGIDSAFELFCVIVLLLLAYTTYKLFKFTKDQRHLYFGLSFLTLAASFVAKIITNIEIYFPSAFYQALGEKTVCTVTSVVKSQLLFTAGYFVHRSLLLLGFLGLIFIITHSKEYRWIPLTVFFVFVISLFSAYAYYVFHITAAVLLFYLAFYFYKNYQKKGKHIPCLIFISFFILLVSAIMFIFVFTNIYFYVFAEILQLLGFLILLYAYLLLVKK